MKTINGRNAMSNELIVQQPDDLAPIADDFLIAMADQAERRIDAVIKIKQVALKVTNARDWTDQQGNPYLQVSGSEKIANLFNISWRIEEPRCEEEPDGHFTYSIRGTFTLGGRSIEVEGTRSSKDPFFNRYDKKGPKDEHGKFTQLLPPSTIDKGDVKKAALTNLFGNGITRMLGIRNLTWSDLEKYAGITQGMIQQKVSYNQREAEQEGRAPIQQPKPKTETKSPSTDENKIISGVDSVTMAHFKKKDGSQGTKYKINAGEQYETFSETYAQEAKRAHESGLMVEIEFTSDQYGRKIKEMKVLKPEAV